MRGTPKNVTETSSDRGMSPNWTKTPTTKPCPDLTPPESGEERYSGHWAGLQKNVTETHFGLGDESQLDKTFD